jgi:dihydroorotate dehydrogenase
MARATAVQRGMAERLQGKVGLIGVGGILEGDDAATKLKAGAALVQIYSGLIYRGPQLIGECVEEIRRQQAARNDH